MGSADRARGLVAGMTLEEKLAWVSGPIALPTGRHPTPPGALGSAAYYPGVARLGVPPVQQTDAGLGVTNPGGVRPVEDVTALPSTLLLGASFDPGSARAAGAVAGREARAHGFGVLLAGGANLVRDPRGGRNFEYVSEDPLLTGAIAGAVVAGIQSARVVSTVKHFALNAQETGRVVLSAELGEADMRESDLLAFQLAIESGQPGAVMLAYNRVNGTYAAESPFLISTVLKGDWGFRGWAMSDWGGTHSTREAVRAGLDVESGADLDVEPYLGPAFRAAVEASPPAHARLDGMVARILLGLIEAGVVDDPPRPGGGIDLEAHRRTVQDAAERGLVLLRNDGTLPIPPGARRILVVGGRAGEGVLSGGGSSQVTPPGSIVEPDVFVDGKPTVRIYHPSSPLEALRAERPEAEIGYADGKDPARAARLARGADVVVLFATEWRSEGLDMPGLSLPHGQDALIAQVAAANPRVVVVLESGGPVSMPWLGGVAAVIAAFYPGSGGGPAIARVLCGAIDATGRLPLTWPADEAQLPRPAQRDPASTTSDPERAHEFPAFQVDYGVEGADAGYRWFARQGLTPLFPFGHGLSYTAFQRSGLRADGLTLGFTVANTGPRAGTDVAQAYVGQDGPEGFVPRLAGFARTELGPGESREVSLRLEPRILARWRPEGFRIGGGVYRVALASCAGDPAALTLDLRLAPRLLGRSGLAA